MGFFDFMDARIGTARWAAKWFIGARREKPSMSDKEIIAAALYSRYKTLRPNANQTALLGEKADAISDIFGLCHLIADVELITDGDIRLAKETYEVMDRELKKLGF